MQVSNEKLKEIADNLDTGFRCYFNIETQEIVTFPDEDRFPDMDTEDWKDDMKKVKKNRKKFKEIESMDSSESFKIMEDFIDSIDDETLKSRLTQAIEGYKPFANFQFQIDRSGPFREMWFAFKANKMIEWVNDQLSITFNNHARL